MPKKFLIVDDLHGIKPRIHFKIGETICINAGYGKDANILMELKGNKIKFYYGFRKSQEGNNR